MPSYPGPHNSAKNLALHGQLMRLIHKKSDFSDIEIVRLYRTLQYRLAILEHVDELVKLRAYKCLALLILKPGLRIKGRRRALLESSGFGDSWALTS